MHPVRFALPAVVLLASLSSLASQAADPAEAVLVDAAGKEQKLKAWKWVAGTRHLTWLEQKEPAKQLEPTEEKKGKAPPKGPPLHPAIGPAALEFREVESTTFANGIVTLIPLDRLRGLEYDPAKKTVTVKFATGTEDVSLTGSTIYKGTNTFALEAEVDRGPAGVAAVKLTGGASAGGFQKATFPTGKVEALKMGRPAAITITHDKKKVVQQVSDLVPLYQLASGAEVTAPALLFKKSLKVDLGTVKKLVNTSPGALETIFEVTMKEGEPESLTLLNHVKLDGKEATFVGLLGKVPGAWKVYPAHTITELEFDPK
jgi:hypothetical protein